jgi:hypothetical protein
MYNNFTSGRLFTTKGYIYLTRLTWKRIHVASRSFTCDRLFIAKGYIYLIRLTWKRLHVTSLVTDSLLLRITSTKSDSHGRGRLHVASRVTDSVLLKVASTKSDSHGRGFT